VGYHLPDFAFIKAPKIQLNFFNLLDNKYLSGVYSVQPSSVATTGVKGTTIASQGTPAYYEGARFAVMVTLSSAF